MLKYKFMYCILPHIYCSIVVLSRVINNAYKWKQSVVVLYDGIHSYFSYYCDLLKVERDFNCLISWAYHSEGDEKGGRQACADLQNQQQKVQKAGSGVVMEACLLEEVEIT